MQLTDRWNVGWEDCNNLKTSLDFNLADVRACFEQPLYWVYRVFTAWLWQQTFKTQEFHVWFIWRVPKCGYLTMNCLLFVVVVVDVCGSCRLIYSQVSARPVDAFFVLSGNVFKIPSKESIVHRHVCLVGKLQHLMCGSVYYQTINPLQLNVSFCSHTNNHLPKFSVSPKLLTMTSCGSLDWSLKS